MFARILGSLALTLTLSLTTAAQAQNYLYLPEEGGVLDYGLERPSLGKPRVALQKRGVPVEIVRPVKLRRDERAIAAKVVDLIR